MVSQSSVIGRWVVDGWTEGWMVDGRMGRQMIGWLVGGRGLGEGWWMGGWMVGVWVADDGC